MTNAPAPLITPPKWAAPVPVVTVRVAPSNVISPPVVPPPCRYAKLLSKPSRSSNTPATLLKGIAPVPNAVVQPARRIHNWLHHTPESLAHTAWSQIQTPRLPSDPQPGHYPATLSVGPPLTLRAPLPNQRQ